MTSYNSTAVEKPIGRRRIALHVQVFWLFTVPIVALIAWKFSEGESAVFSFNAAVAFLGYSVLMVWTLPALKGPGIGYPLQVISLIWFIVYGIGARVAVRENDFTAITVTYSAGFATMALSLGYLLGKYGFGKGKQIDLRRLSLSSMRQRAIMFAVLAALATLYFVAVGGFPALHSNALVYRFEVRAKVSSYVVFMLRSSQLPLYVWWAFYQLGYIRKTHGNIARMWFAIALVLFVNFIPGWRNPLMFIAFNLIFINILASPRKSRLGILILGAGSAVTVLAMGFVRLLRLAQTQTVDAIVYFSTFTTDPIAMFFLWASANFSTYTLGFIAALRIFPDTVGHLYGGVMATTLMTMLPGKQELLDEKLKRWSGMEFDGGGLNLTILGESYADFGYFGLILYPLLYGLVLGILIRNAELAPTPARVLLAAFTASSLSLGSLTGLLSLSSFWVLGGFLVFITLGEKLRPYRRPLASTS